ncbi:MAG: 4Fe-4S ferredoxin, partial [Gallionella sp.]
MSDELIIYVLYVIPLVLVMFFYLRRHSRRQKVHKETLRENITAGLTEPASLHPVFDPNVCIGSGGC